MIRVILISLLISLVYCNESSCISPCSKSSVPQCGTWLSNERMREAAGMYELGKGIVNMSCSFSSLPRPATITWLHRPFSTSSWSPFTCSTKDENISCSTSSEQKVSSSCILPTKFLNITGSYKCEAITENQYEENSKAYSSEVSVVVVGIESVRIVDKRIRKGQEGFVEAKICANPQPEVWWSTVEGMVKAGQTLSNFASSHLAKSVERDAIEGPASVRPYCYQLRLVIRRVAEGESLSLLVRSHEGVSSTLILSSCYSVAPSLALLFFTLSLIV